jgi:hypothetical protein
MDYGNPIFLLRDNASIDRCLLLLFVNRQEIMWRRKLRWVMKALTSDACYLERSASFNEFVEKINQNLTGIQ